MTDEEKMSLLKRYVEDPSLFSDNGVLRAEIARLFGWTVGEYPRGMAPWCRRFVNTREFDAMHDLVETVNAARNL